jgi:hypothetical protein
MTSSRLQREAVGVTVHYHPPVHLMSYFRDIPACARRLPDRRTNRRRHHPLPLYAAMPDAHADEVARLRRVVQALPSRPELRRVDALYCSVSLSVSNCPVPGRMPPISCRRTWW